MEKDKFFDKSNAPSVWDDKVDFKVNIVDNGDDKVSISIALKDNQSIDLVCNQYIPHFDASKIMFAGSGSATYIKQVRIS